MGADHESKPPPQAFLDENESLLYNHKAFFEPGFGLTGGNVAGRQSRVILIQRGTKLEI